MHGIVELARGRAGGDAVSASIGSDHPVRLFTRRRKTKSIMPVMSQILRRLGRWGAVLGLWYSFLPMAHRPRRRTGWMKCPPSQPWFKRFVKMFRLPSRRVRTATYPGNQGESHAMSEMQQ